MTAPKVWRPPGQFVDKADEATLSRIVAYVDERKANGSAAPWIVLVEWCVQEIRCRWAVKAKGRSVKRVPRTVEQAMKQRERERAILAKIAENTKQMRKEIGT